MIWIENIHKTYGAVRALKGVSLEVKRGELFGLIGPDGGGKTSLFRILTTLIDADPVVGSAAYIGTADGLRLDVAKDMEAIRSSVGYMPGRFSLYQDLSVEENITFFATLFGTTVEENYHLVSDIYSHLEPFKDRRAGKLSGGMKQKLALSCALIHKPTVLFLDEPTTGVDPVSRKEFWQMLKRLKEGGLTILVSTPYMDEAMLCDRIALINDGTIIGVDTPQGFVDRYPRAIYAVRGREMYRMLKTLRTMVCVASAYAFGDKHHVTLCDGVTEQELHERLVEEGYADLLVCRITPTVEDYFILIEQGI